MCQVTANATFHDHELNQIPVLNPGDWWGKTWLLEIGGSVTPLFLIVEADTVQDAIDELADDEKHGHLICVPNEDLGDYDPNDCHYGPSGQVIDLDHLMIHGQEGVDCPFPCKYFGDDLPEEGIAPTEFYCREDG
jgi:hypothetical protein